MILSHTKTAAHDVRATVIRLFSIYAIRNPVASPTIPEIIYDVDDRIAGKIIAARHA